jgi:signal transduction histidine kinase
VAVENARLRQQAEQAAILEERQRLARDLHDVVSQSLFSASVIAETLPRLWKHDPETVRQSLADLHRLTRGALAEMRTLLLELRPDTLMEADLEDLLRQLTEAIAGRTQMAVSLRVEGQPPSPTEAKTTLFRLAQEALNNIVKHARASQVTVTLNSQPDQIVLSISDDGRGFDPNNVPSGHLGLDIMRERAEAIGATLKITSQPGQGAEVVIIWPRT